MVKNKLFTLFLLIIIFVIPIDVLAVATSPLETDSATTAEEAKQKKQKRERVNEETKPNLKAVTRRSRVANAIQEIMKIGDRRGGIGEQVRVIAQDQNQNHEMMEQAIQIIKNKGRLKKFLFGPNYKQIENIEDRIALFNEQAEKLRELGKNILIPEDIEKLKEKLVVMEQVKNEWQDEVNNEKKGFSLFGWLVKLINK